MNIQERFTNVRKLAEKVTPGKWDAVGEGRWNAYIRSESGQTVCDIRYKNGEQDSAFIVAAQNLDWEAIGAHIAALEKVAELAESLCKKECLDCSRGTKLQIEPETGRYTHNLGANYCSASFIHKHFAAALAELKAREGKDEQIAAKVPKA